VLEAVGFNPVGYHLVELGVACVALIHTFFEDVIEFGLKRPDVSGAGGAGGHEFLPVFVELNDVEIVTTVRGAGGTGTGALTGAEKREAGWKGEGFLAAGEQDVDAEFVHRDGNDGEGRDAVDDEHDVRILADDGSDVGQRVHDTGGGFVVDQGDCVEFAGRKFFIDHFGEDGLAPFDLQTIGMFAAAFADIEPLVGEGAAHAVEDFFLHKVANGALHHAPSGRGCQVDRSVRAEEGLQPGVNVFVKTGKLAAAVADLRVAKCAEGFVGDFDGAGDEEFHVSVGRGVGGVEHVVSFPK